MPRNDVFCSDHLPLTVSCELTIVMPKLPLSTTLFSINKVVWGERDCNQINEYHNLCNESLKLINFPQELSLCSDAHCNNTEHKVILDRMYASIISILTESAVSSHVGRRQTVKRGRVVGWNRHVSDAHRQARLAYQSWLWHNMPTSGDVYDNMCLTRKIYKGKLKWCKKHQEQILLDIIASYRKAKDFKNFWKSTNKLNAKPGLPVSVSI